MNRATTSRRRRCFRVLLLSLRWKYETSNIVLELPILHAWRTGRCLPTTPGSCWPSPVTRGYDCATSRPPWASRTAAATATRSRAASCCPGRPATRHRRAARPPHQPARDHGTQLTGGPRPRGGWPRDWPLHYRARQDMFCRGHTSSRHQMAVIRFDPFRDPFGAAVVHGRDGGRVPRSACLWTSTAPGMAATTSRPTCRRRP
jgi:hypothetical protein